MDVFANCIYHLLPMPFDLPDLGTFQMLAARCASQPGSLVPMYRRLMSDQLTPVLAYRRLVRPDDRMAPSFLFESVVGGDRVGRYSFLGAQPIAQIIARGFDIEYRDMIKPEKSRKFHSTDPLSEMDRISGAWKLVPLPGVKDLPDFTGGWVGYAGYDTVRFSEGEKLPKPPKDDRHLPDLHMQLYRDVVVFDQAQKSVLVITHVMLSDFADVREAYQSGQARLDMLVGRIETVPTASGMPELAVGHIDLRSAPPSLPPSNMGTGGYQKAVVEAKKYISAGDIFQVVPSQRFELKTSADPFDIYRALRVVNPSPYMFYLQIEGAMLVGSSPEILCKVQDRHVTNRPLAGTRRRGRDDAEDKALEAELIADPKDRAEHIMLVDLGRNDVGRVCKAGSIQLPEVMTVERYSHVMHLSSTVVGQLRDECTCWDALRVTLPVGTVSGAPKIRAMEIIDELEPTRRGPYGGAVGYTDFNGNMDMAIALRTMVVLPSPGSSANTTTPPWTVHLQAGGGIVADSDPDAENQETINKAAALAKAVDLAEKAFGRSAN